MEHTFRVPYCIYPKFLHVSDLQSSNPYCSRTKCVSCCCWMTCSIGVCWGERTSPISLFVFFPITLSIVESGFWGLHVLLFEFLISTPISVCLASGSLVLCCEAQLKIFKWKKTENIRMHFCSKVNSVGVSLVWRTCVCVCVCAMM